MILFVSHLAQHRFTRFLLLGGTAAIVNLLMMYFLVDVLAWETPVWKNLANAVSMEISLLYSFFVYRTYVWGDDADRFHAGIGNQLLRYHGAAGSVNLVRFLVVFPFLDLVGIHHLANTLIAIPVGCVVNYFISTKFIFAANAEKTSDLDSAKQSKWRSAYPGQAPLQKSQLQARHGIDEAPMVHGSSFAPHLEQLVRLRW